MRAAKRAPGQPGWNRTGLVLGALYVLASVGSILLSQGQSDDKGAIFFGQLPLLPAFAVAVLLGVIDWFAATSWWAAYGVCIPLTAMAIYGLCWLAGMAQRRIGRAVVPAVAVSLLIVLLALTLIPR